MTALSLLTNAEKAAVLDVLIATEAGLGRRSEEEARRSLATVKIDHVGSAVAEDLLALDQDDLAAHAGRTRYGYVEPTEAAWLLLERALEPWLDDLRRRAILGLEEAARQIGRRAHRGGTHRLLDRPRLSSTRRRRPRAR